MKFMKVLSGADNLGNWPKQSVPSTKEDGLLERVKKICTYEFVALH